MVELLKRMREQIYREAKTMNWLDEIFDESVTVTIRREFGERGVTENLVDLTTDVIEDRERRETHVELNFKGLVSHSGRSARFHTDQPNRKKGLLIALGRALKNVRMDPRCHDVMDFDRADQIMKIKWGEVCPRRKR